MRRRALGERVRLTYGRVRGGYAVTGYRGRLGPCLDIPERHSGRPVVEIASGAFDGCGTLAEVRVPVTVTRVGRFAFAGCRALREVSGAEGVEEIENGAFLGCSRLSSFTVPPGCTAIGRNAFLGCGRLLEVENLSPLAIKAGSHAYGEIAAHAVIVSPDARGSGRVFRDADGFVFYSLGDICYLTGYEGPEADVRLPPSAEGRPYAVGSCAFSWRDDIVSVEVPEGVTRFCEDAFSGCVNIGRVSVPSLGAWLWCEFADAEANPLCCGGVLSVGGEDLPDIRVPEGTVRIPPYAFAGSAVKNVYLPPSVRSFGRGAFSGCRDLASVRIDDLASWCSACFDGPDAGPLARCDSLFVAGERAYDLCIPEGVEEISPYAFLGYSGAVSVTLPRSLRKIGEDAFSRCLRIREVVNLSPLDVRAGDLGNGCVAAYASRVRADVGAEPLTKKDADGFLWREEDGRTLLSGYVGEEKDLSLPPCRGGAYVIAERLFYGSNSLSSVSLPDGLKALSEDAFWECGALARVRMGRGLERVDAWSFTGCRALREIEIPAGVRSVGRYAFAFCSSLSSVTLPDGLEEIGDAAFSCTALERVEVPGSVRKVGDIAFSTDAGTLTVFYGGSRGEWEKATEGWLAYDREVLRVLFYREKRPLFRKKRFWRRGEGGEPEPW